MVKLTNYGSGLKQIVLLLTLGVIFSCGRQHIAVSKIEGKELPITSALTADESVEAFIRPYREAIEKDLNTVLSYAPETMDKSQGQWQTTIGNLMADACLDAAKSVMSERENLPVDACMLNFGGIRSIIPEGEVTTRTAFEVMPFENSLIVAELRGSEIRELAGYIVRERKAHPVSGIQFMISDNKPVGIVIGGRPLSDSEIYRVATSDYLINGGDNMNFFKKAVRTYDLNYKIRNVLIDYFKKTDTLPVLTDIRIRTSS